MSEATRRSVFLDEIGLGPIWLRRERVPASNEAAPELADVSPPAAVALAAQLPVVAMSEAEPQPAAVLAPAAVASARDAAPSAWAEDGAVNSAPPAPATAISLLQSPAAMDWPQLQTAVAECTACGLCRGRKNTVFGVGDSKARWLFIGEGPGRNEDIQGEPFVGPAGKLLDNILLAMGLARGQNAYIANIVKCRPTDENGRDRPPAADEVAACMPYLQRQIELIQPTVLVALGKTAALSLLGLDPSTPVSKLRGSVHRYAERPLIVTYHPAYLLRQLADKGKVWSDLCLAMSTYANTPE
ncbi:uracil-DNA glycosylase [Collimonas sp.]|jgi:uracil-DNA glycosylase family 4|uniref:uracil-DNA glycosylase n=1 Tax=Collimonas sp. TaxID=1963772 RepID=UPI002CE45B05|nr:uracil-DNA glycosylase [Collimonas sp.]HWX00538.1 uracil-DNA glycosylase [Collimonas sp.]